MVMGFFANAGHGTSGQERPVDIVDLSEYAPSVLLDLRYGTTENFVGAIVVGYEAPRALLTKRAADALNTAQLRLLPLGYSLKIYDAYRPQRAVAHFVKWARDPMDTRTKQNFYPDVPKSELFARGYIALESSHSRGSTVDVTLMRRSADGNWRDVDMGSPYDFFGKVSAPDTSGISAEAAALRSLLRAVMIAHGFEPYSQEWWHFTLKDEPYSDTYFDFPLS
jgi:D-alanyl-D-alanine dipeptidase